MNCFRPTNSYVSLVPCNNIITCNSNGTKNPKNYSRNIKIDSLRSACVLSLYLTNLPCYASIPWMIVWVILRENGDHERKWNHINEISGAFRYISLSLKLVLWLCFSWLFIHLDRFGVKWVCCHYHYMDPNPDEWACVCVFYWHWISVTTSMCCLMMR